jgi:hypothetical protein
LRDCYGPPGYQRRADRFVEVLDRFLGLLQPPFGDALVAIDASLDEIGDLGRGQCLVEAIALS